MLGRVSTFLALVRLAVPDLYRAFAEVIPTLGTLGEGPALERLYLGLPSIDFSRLVLSPRPDRLAVLPVRGVHWDDLGEPGRVVATRRRTRAMVSTMADALPRNAETRGCVPVAAPA